MPATRLRALLVTSQMNQTSTAVYSSGISSTACHFAAPPMNAPWLVDQPSSVSGSQNHSATPTTSGIRQQRTQAAAALLSQLINFQSISYNISIAPP